MSTQCPLEASKFYLVPPFMAQETTINIRSSLATAKMNADALSKSKNQYATAMKSACALFIVCGDVRDEHVEGLRKWGHLQRPTKDG